MVEDNFHKAEIRLLNMEADVGKPPESRPSSTLWEGIQCLDGNVAVISTQIKGDLARDLVLVTKIAESSPAMAKKARLGVDNLKLTMGQNRVVVLEAKVVTLEGHIQFLQTLVTDSSDLMLEIINNKIPIANSTTGSATGTAGAVI